LRLGDIGLEVMFGEGVDILKGEEDVSRVDV
jgi:hypothetical protein